MSRHDIIVIGASAGGVEALKELVSGLPPDFPVAVFVVLHIPAQSPSVLPSILRRVGALEAIQPGDGDAIQPGRIYVAPPDHHLLVQDGYVRIVRGPRENRHRPAADPLFRSAAHAYGPRVVGVVLTGMFDDGTAGLLAVKARGGVAIVQDPNEALYPGMPRSALENVKVDYCLPLSGIAARLVQLANEPVEIEGAHAMPEGIEIESKIAQMEESNMGGVEKLGSPSAFTCPECHGTLWELHDGELLRFRCHVGHAFSAESLQAEQAQALETALWSALRALEENVAMAQRMAARARKSNHHLSAARYEERARETEQHAALMRQMLFSSEEASEQG